MVLRTFFFLLSALTFSLACQQSGSTGEESLDTADYKWSDCFCTSNEVSCGDGYSVAVCNGQISYGWGCAALGRSCSGGRSSRTYKPCKRDGAADQCPLPEPAGRPDGSGHN